MIDELLMISGRMSDSQQRRIRWAWIAPLPVLAFMLFAMYHSMTAPVRSGRDLGWPGTLLIGWIPIGLIYLSLRARRRVITHFDYDGATLRYQTINCPGGASRAIAEIYKIDEWRNRAGRIGYILVFRDGAKLTLSLQIDHAEELITKLQRDRWPIPIALDRPADL
jgi:hypothetical protein